MSIQLELLNEGGDEQTRLGRQIQAAYRVGEAVSDGHLSSSELLYLVE